jgi:hypothetical protein
VALSIKADTISSAQLLRRLGSYSRLKRFGDYTLSMSSPDPFDTDLVVPFPLEDLQKSTAIA